MRKELIMTNVLIFCLLAVNHALAYEIVLDNYALGASASASDIGYGWLPSRAVDGNSGTGYHSTENDAINHWLEVDLGQPRTFQRIEVLNRAGYLTRLDGATVVALDTSRNVLFTSAAITGGPLVAQYDGNFAGVRYLRVEHSGPILTVMELRALTIYKTDFLPPDSNLTQFGAIAEQSTTGAGRPASIAIDGVLGDFSHTDETTPDNWWKVTLAEEFYIDKVIIYNRVSCCSERLLNQVLTVIDDDGNEVFRYKFTDPSIVGPGSVHTFEMPKPTYARYVKVGLENGQPNGQASNNNYVVALEEVQVIGGSYQGPWNPVPANGAVEVNVDQDLSWSPGEDPNGVLPGTTGYFVYFGTNARAVFVRDPGVAKGLLDKDTHTFDPGTLARDTTYYWAVDQRLIDDANSVPSVVWKFTTPLTLPIIEQQPTDAVTIAGGYAKFTIFATDPLGVGVTYAWHKVGSSTILSTTDALEIIDVGAGDVGKYVCEVSNINTISSKTVELRLAKPVVRWKFDEASGKTAADSSGNGINGALGSGFTDNEWILNGGRTGQSGDNAIFFPGNSNATVTALNVDLNTKPVNNIFLGASSWTINLWLKIPTTSGISMIGGFGDNVFVEGSGLNDRYYNTWDGTIEFNMGEDGFWETPFTAEQWQMWSLTYDSVSDTLTYYRDRVVIATKTLSLIDVTENAFKLGVGDIAWADAEVPLKAMIDDFSVWDEALGPFELGMLDKGYGCTQDIPGDIDGNCMIDLADLSTLAAGWLDCGLVPDCLE